MLREVLRDLSSKYDNKEYDEVVKLMEEHAKNGEYRINVNNLRDSTLDRLEREGIEIREMGFSKTNTMYELVWK